MAMQKLKETRRNKELSTVTSTNINLPFITANQGYKHLDTTLTRRSLRLTLVVN